MRELWRARPVATILVSLLVIAAIVGMLSWLWGVSAPGATGAQLGTFATAVSAFAAAGAALASWRSAAKSDATSQRASEAVGMAIRPDVQADLIDRIWRGGDEFSCIEVRNYSLWPAANVSVIYDSGEGWTSTAQIRDLSAARLPAGNGYPDNPAKLQIDVPLTPKKWEAADHPDWRGKKEIVETTTIEFEDERGFLRWRRVEKYRRTYVGTSEEGGGMLSTTLDKVH